MTTSSVRNMANAIRGAHRRPTVNDRRRREKTSSPKNDPSTGEKQCGINNEKWYLDEINLRSMLAEYFNFLVITNEHLGVIINFDGMKIFVES